MDNLLHPQQLPQSSPGDEHAVTPKMGPTQLVPSGRSVPYALGYGLARQFPLLLPLQFPSLGHLDEDVEATIGEALAVDGISPKTGIGYRNAFRRFRAFLTSSGDETVFLTGQLPEQVRILRGWIAWLRASGCNHTTVNHYWRMLHGLLKRVALARGALDPTSAVETPRAGRSMPRFLTRDALERVLEFVRNYPWPGGSFTRHRNVALVATMALGGLRRGEVLRLAFGDVDLTSRKLRVVRGKGRHGGKDRTVYLAPGLVQALIRYVEVRPKNATSAFFLSTRADAGISPETLKRLCDTITTVGGVKVTNHMFRHTAATLMRQAGLPDRLAMEQLGHSSLVVLQRYSHVADGELAAEIQRLDVRVP
jgi:integrase